MILTQPQIELSLLALVMSSDMMSDIFAYGDATLIKVIKQTPAAHK